MDNFLRRIINNTALIVSIETLILIIVLRLLNIYDVIIVESYNLIFFIAVNAFIDLYFKRR